MTSTEMYDSMYRLKCCPSVLFIVCYIPPVDSPSCRMEAIAEVNAAVQTIDSEELVLIGDLNCCYATLRQAFIADKHCTAGLSYAASLDNAKVPNENAKLLIDILNPLILINGLTNESKCFSNQLTYRQKDQWISELDHCYVTPNLLESIRDFRVESRLDLPSDHAPICVSLSIDTLKYEVHFYEKLCERASQLCHHPVASPWSGPNWKQIRWSKTVVPNRLCVAPPFCDRSTEISPPLKNFRIK